MDEARVLLYEYAVTSQLSTVRAMSELRIKRYENGGTEIRLGGSLIGSAASDVAALLSAEKYLLEQREEIRMALERVQSELARINADA